MNADLVKLLRCPETGKLLRLEGQEERGARIYSGWLVSEGNGRRYPIKGFIPRFVPEQNYADNFGLQWNLHAKTQLDSFTGLPISRNRLFQVTGWAENMPGARILEAGSG